jgi:hypothetical protein
MWVRLVLLNSNAIAGMTPLAQANRNSSRGCIRIARAPSSRCGQPLRDAPYSGVCIVSRKGNIAITISNRVTSASCIVGSQLSTGKAFTGVPNIAPPPRVAHPTEVVEIAGQTKLYLRTRDSADGDGRLAGQVLLPVKLAK